jgi:hypothetical protein
MESRRTRVTVQLRPDVRARVWRTSLPIVLVGVAVAAVATTGDGGGVARAHYLRQLVFGPAGPGVQHRAPAADARLMDLDSVPAIPAARPRAARTVVALPGSAAHGHRARTRRGGVLGHR